MTEQDFSLDPRLASDCHHLGKLDNSELLLMNNAYFPWLVLVPRCQHSELYQLEAHQQHLIIEHVNILSNFIKQEFCCDKLNIASIGNIVKQLHIHIIGRHHDDPCWPGVVWGTNHTTPYSDTDVLRIRHAISEFLGENFLIAGE